MSVIKIFYGFCRQKITYNSCPDKIWKSVCSFSVSHFELLLLRIIHILPSQSVHSQKFFSCKLFFGRYFLLFFFHLLRLNFGKTLLFLFFFASVASLLESIGLEFRTLTNWNIYCFKWTDFRCAFSSNNWRKWKDIRWSAVGTFAACWKWYFYRSFRSALILFPFMQF